MIRTMNPRKENSVYKPSKDFDLRNRRLMLSLGPLSRVKFCTYSCPFCYVNSPDYLNFVSMTIGDIINWAAERTSKFDLIYVSGDTDSFAPPRTNKGLDLLDALSEFDADLLFTTRALLSEGHYQKLSEIQKKLRNKDRLLIGCVSISQLHHPHLEPKPIPSPEDRIKQLMRLKQLNIISVLALRPFLPIVPPNEYLEILEQSKQSIHLVLGSDWYADKGGILEDRVFLNEKADDTRIVYEQMDCDVNDAIWKIYKNDEVEKSVRATCESYGLPFFMRSLPAINWLRDNKNKLDI